MNLPNRLTVARLFLTLCFVVVLSLEFPYHHTVAFAIFVLATLTDYFDGEIARRYNLVTNFGILMDPLVDKIMVTAAFITLIPRGVMPSWVAIVVIVREFLITGLRLLAAEKGQVLPAESLGKHKTSWQIATILYFLLFLSSQEIFGRMEGATAQVWLTALYYGGIGMIAIMVTLTVLSGARYLWKNWSLIAGT